MRPAFFIVITAFLLATSTSCTHAAEPVVIHVLRDASASFTPDLRTADLQFASTQPHVRTGKGVIVATNEGTSFQFLLGRFKESTPDLVIFDSQATIPFDPYVRKELVTPELVCGEHPAFIPTSINGEHREATEMYLRFLVAKCTTSVAGSTSTTKSEASAVSNAPEADPHRPPCNTERCRKIKAFLKNHYCGESPFGNGPDDGCDLRDSKQRVSGTLVKAAYECHWSETELKSVCEQKGETSPEIREILVRELRRVGLPRGGEKELYFNVLESKSGWSLLAANYWHISGPDLTLCQVVLLTDRSGLARVLRKVPLQKTNVDVSTLTTWAPIDLADVDGDGEFDVVLQGDAYEDHWLEVDSVGGGSVKTIFSGLGYYL